MLKQNEAFTKEIEQHICSGLRSVLKSEPADHPSVLRLLHSITAIGKPKDGESILREVLLKPLITKAFGASKGRKEIKTTIQQYLKGVDTVYDGFFTVLLDSSQRWTQFDFIGNCLLFSFHEYLSENLPSVFSAGFRNL